MAEDWFATGKAYVYFAVDLESRLVKIGCVRGKLWGKCPVTRVMELAVLNRKQIQFLGCIQAEEGDKALELEADLHQRFASSRIDGEWFQPSAALADLIGLKASGHVCYRCIGATTEGECAVSQAVGKAIRGKSEFAPQMGLFK